MEEFAPDLVVTDLKMPGMDGIQLLGKIRESDADLPVIVMTAFGEVETAVGAMRAGARDYLSKPVNVGELSVVVERELAARRLRAEAGLLRARLSEKYSFDNIIGSAAPMQEVFKTVAQIASSRASVLITGESGTGKELIAAAIHERSPRAAGPFVKLHCAALAESLLESELFGHERGSFTGAAGRRDGRFHQANHGTLFLDEIGEISPAVQVKLLRFLQEREFERVGGNETISVDVRVIAATNRDLAEDGRGGEVPGGSLLPAQRHQSGDADAARASFRHPAAGRALPAQVRGRKRQADLGLLGRGARAPRRLPLAGQRARAGEHRRARGRARRRRRRSRSAELPPQLVPAKVRGGLQIPGATMDEIERYAITKTLESTGGSTSRAAEILNLSVRKIQYKLHEYESAPKSARPSVSETEDDK